MRIIITKDIETNEILERIRKLEKKRKLTNNEITKLGEYKRAIQEYEESGELYFNEEYVTELTLKRFRQIFTSKRLDVLNQLDKKNFTSIAELSRFLKRDIKNVYDDLKILEKFNLVKLEKQSKNVIPKINVESISLEFLST